MSIQYGGNNPSLSVTTTSLYVNDTLGHKLPLISDSLISVTKSISVMHQSKMMPHVVSIQDSQSLAQNQMKTESAVQQPKESYIQNLATPTIISAKSLTSGINVQYSLSTSMNVVKNTITPTTASTTVSQSAVKSGKVNSFSVTVNLLMITVNIRG